MVHCHHVHLGQCGCGPSGWFLSRQRKVPFCRIAFTIAQSEWTRQMFRRVYPYPLEKIIHSRSIAGVSRPELDSRTVLCRLRSNNARLGEEKLGTNLRSD